MIAHPSGIQTHLYPIHMTLLIFMSTAYLCLFNHGLSSVSAFSASDLSLKHHLIKNFDVIERGDIQWSKSVSSRGVDNQLLHDGNDQSNDDPDAITILEQQQPPSKKLQFSSFGKTFKLILSKPAHLVTQDFTVISLNGDGQQTLVPYSLNDINVLNGFMDGEPKSEATASFNKQDELLTAQIKTAQGTVIVEPTYMHRDNIWSGSDDSDDASNLTQKLYNETMIVYNLNDHKQFDINNVGNTTSDLFNPENLCAALNMSDYKVDITRNKLETNQKLDPEIEDVFKIYSQSPKKGSRTKRGIELLTEQSKDKTRCTLHLVADYLFYKNIGNGDFQTTINYLLALINRVNQIYLPTVWETGDDRVGPFSNVGFTVQNITIHREYTRVSSGDEHYNMQSDKKWVARDFLDNFSRYSPPKHYCLAHLLTYRQFDSPVLGLAYVASTRFGTVGGLCSPTQQKGDILYKHNTGISTSKGISGETLITRQADLVLAHELGHNFGAEHDSNECRPSPSEGGAYLMHPFAVMGFEKNNKFLSNCSRLTIGRVLRRKASSCLVAVVDHVCGNGIVEDDEECDGGDVGHGHNDPCCDSSCRFTPGSQCSDRHSWCCNKCRIQSAGFPCRPAEEYNCKKAGVCDGHSADCPVSPPVENNKVCVGRGLCLEGECQPFCEARNLTSCLCNNPKDACKLCCKTSPISTCVPYNTNAPYLPDGVLCYRGVCEKGRCEQPIQDAVERLWDVLEDINFTTFVKFLRDNIIIVVLVVSIPLWCIAAHYINEFDKRIKEDVMTAIIKNNRRRTKDKHPYPSPFLPRLFVGDDTSNQTNSAEDVRMKNGNRIDHIEADVTSV